MSAITGGRLEGDAHLTQSIADILSTPIGTRIMRRDYGSTIFELIDQPMNALGRLRLFAATAEALRRWEPRLRLTRVALASAEAAGRFVLQLEGERVDAPASSIARLTIPLAFQRSQS